MSLRATFPVCVSTFKETILHVQKLEIIFFWGGKYLSLHLLETLETFKSKNHKTNSINKYSDTFVLSEIPQLCYMKRLLENKHSVGMLMLLAEVEDTT